MKNFTFKMLLTLLLEFMVFVTSAQEWNFSSNSFNSLGTISETKTVDGLNIFATNDAVIVVQASSNSLDGINFNKRLMLGGSGSFDVNGNPVSRVLSFPVSGNSKITIIMGMTSSTIVDRELYVTAGNKETIIGKFPAIGESISKVECTYTGGPTTIYLYSPANNVNLYYIKAEENTTVNITAGNLATTLTAQELASVTNLTITGTIDARDFKTMRDNMPSLSVIDLSGCDIVYYLGFEGTSGSSNIAYPENGVPDKAFCYYTGNTSLTSVILSTSATSIGMRAFYGCFNLNSFTILSSISLIRDDAFVNSSALLVVEENNPNYSSLDGVLFNKELDSLIFCPYSKTGNYDIPSSVKVIWSNAFYNSWCSSISIPSSVITIQSTAFQSSRSLNSISIPSSVKYIGSYAFSGCERLKSIYINSRKPINISTQQNVFDSVDKIACILYVPFGTSELYSSASQWQDFINIIEVPGFQVSTTKLDIGENSGSTASVNIVSDVTWTASSNQSWLSINRSSGTGEQQLTFTADANSQNSVRNATITISATGVPSQTITVKQGSSQFPSSLNISAGTLAKLFTFGQMDTITHLKLTGTIDARDFKTMRDDLPQLLDLDISEATIVEYTGIDGTDDTGSITYPGNEIPTFAFCTTSNSNVGKPSLNMVKLPLSITSIGSYSFLYCKGLSLVNIPSNVISIGRSAFNGCTSLASITLEPSSSLKIIGMLAFRDCAGLTSITIPRSVTAIDYGAFLNCSGLSSINFESPSMLNYIGLYAFENCTSLMSISLPSLVETIDYRAFYNCTSLTSLNVPSSVKRIGRSAFYGCVELTSVAIDTSSKLDTIGQYAFGLCAKLTSFTIPKTVSLIEDVVFLGTSAQVTVDSNNPNYTSFDDVLFDKDKTRLMYCPTFKTGTYEIPSTVNSIGVDAFHSCSELTAITLPSGLKMIEEWAFEDCISLTSISIPATVDSIGSYAFYSCTGLTSLFSYSPAPVYLSSKTDVFFDIDKTKCILYVPFGSSGIYSSANQWQDFENILDLPINYSVNKPVLLTPLNGATISGKFAFTWMFDVADGDNLKYRLYLRNLMNETDSIDLDDAKLEIDLEDSSLEENLILYWSVRAFDGKDWGPISEQRMLTLSVENNSPSAPVLISPTDDYTCAFNENINFSWSESVDPEGDPVKYVIYINPNSTGWFIWNTIENTSQTGNFQSNQRYEWKVKAIDSKGNESEYSETRSFFVDWKTSAKKINDEFSIIKVYPNPTSGLFQIIGLSGNNENTLSIYDVLGQLVSQKITASGEASFDISQQKPGIYFLVINDDKTQTFKIIKE